MKHLVILVAIPETGFDLIKMLLNYMLVICAIVPIIIELYFIIKYTNNLTEEVKQLIAKVEQTEKTFEEMQITMDDWREHCDYFNEVNA